MLSKLKCVEYDADDIMRTRALAVAEAETSKWMAEEKEYRLRQKALEDRAARNIQFRWRLRQLGMLDYWLWKMPSMKDKKKEEEKKKLVEEKKKTIATITGAGFDDPTEWEQCSDGYGGIYYYNINTEKSQWTKPNFRQKNAEVAPGPGFEDNVSVAEVTDQFDDHPEHWEICHADGNTVYYYNTETGESRWRRPRFKTDVEYAQMKEGTNSEEHFAKMEMMIQIGNIHEDWESVKDEQGRLYFWNRISGESRWEAPPRSWIPDYSKGSLPNKDNNASFGQKITEQTEINVSLPEGWSIEFDSVGNIYYYNSTSGESTWELPRQEKINFDIIEEAKPPTPESGLLLSNFEECVDANGNIYYYNKHTNESTWEKPYFLPAS
jgi:hypothetical protein